MGQLVIPDSAIVYADTSVFIYSIEAHPTYYTVLEPLWTKFYAGTIELISSELTLTETLVIPMRDRDNELINTYEQFLLFSNVRLIPISQAILRSAAQIRATTNLKTPDAIHGATALAESTTLLITNDNQFRNLSGLSVVVLSEVLAT